MNTPTSFTKYLRPIVTCLLVAGVSACSSQAQRQPDHSQADNAAPTELVESEEATEGSMMAQTEDTEQKHSSNSAIRIKASHPRKYTVKKGDTLWDISSQFLRDPWYWPEIWHNNRQVQNPHLIYPGDVLTLIYINGQPQIQVNDTAQQKTSHTTITATATAKTTEINDQNLRVVKLSPSIRKQGLDASVITIPGDAIRQFLTKPRVVTKEELESAPYILASDDDHLIMARDNTIYVRGELDKDRVRFTVFRPGNELIDPETDEVFGYEATYAGEARITEYGDPATAQLTSTEREVLIGDRLLPVDKSKISNLYYPRAPDREVKGQIISLFDALFGIAKFQVAVINRGNRDGIEVGHLLATLTSGGIVNDKYNLREKGNIALPNKRSGLMMVFRTFDKVSYGLIIESTRVISSNDVVVSPK
ncbi:MAG: LysM peptidoglycan-binding domain-containing protein [Gammaproteobacteria bacterium]|nr:LysM peptidoglycan-binding domain-containing protein [Gammaproteobacteria bacterium]